MNSPLTEYLLILLRGTTRDAAGQEARRLNIRLDWAEYYWRVITR